MSEAVAITFSSIVAAIVSLITIVVSIFTVVISNHLSSDAKRKEIKLQNYHKDRIEAVKTLYGLIVELNYANIGLFDVDNKEWGHYNYKSALKHWLSAYTDVYGYYSKNRILLLESSQLSNAVRAKLNQLSPLRNAIVNEHSHLENIEEQMSGYLEHYYEDADTETKLIKKRLNDLKSNSNIAHIISSFETIREELEMYFKTLIS